MAIVARRKGGDDRAPAADPEEKKSLLKSRRPAGARGRMVLDNAEGLSLSLELSEPSTEIGDYLWIFYGAKKDRKSVV